jgi:hypothetical protein
LKRALIRLFGSAYLLVLCEINAVAQTPAPSLELNTLLMHATFLISGPNKDNPAKTSVGTVFVMGISRPNDPKVAAGVMVTAAHVLNDIGTDNATLIVRRKNVDGTYTSYQYDISIRDKKQPRYIENPTADVAAMYVDLPTDVPITVLPPEFLADDNRLENIELHPGDEVFCLGFPLALMGPGGFPVLRTGHIASYPPHANESCWKARC